MIGRFAVADESGAVSADWLALGAGLVGLCLALMATLADRTASLGGTTGAAIAAVQATVLGTSGPSGTSGMPGASAEAGPTTRQ